MICMFLCVETLNIPYTFPQKARTNKQIQQSCRIQTPTHKNQLHFYILMSYLKRNLKNNSFYNSIKNKISSNKPNQGGERLVHHKLQNTAEKIKHDINKFMFTN